MTELRIETVNVNSLIPDPANARKHDGKNLQAIAHSLEKFGQRKPICVTPDSIVVAGNGTLEAAKSLGWTEIVIARTPVGWTWEQIRAFALADNRTAELAEWDDKVLADQLLELDANGWELEELGFANLEPPLGQDEDEEPLSFDDAPTRSKIGDTWILGNHRLFCGDSFNEALFSDLDFETIISDPPYGMSFVSNYRKVKHSEIKNDDNFDALNWIIDLTANHSKYIFCRWDNLATVKKPTSFITWIKNNWSMGDLEHSHARQTETILFYPGANHSFPSSRPTDVVKFDRTQNDLHPTQKPIDLMIEVIGWTKGNIFDPFAGSGATLIAAEKLKRTCYAIELEPKYVDVIIKRWEDLTGLEAKLLED
jgi:site-specific DNA-methyltransferase (adenine-specific)